MRKFSFLFALLCVSVMSFAIDWSGYAWIGNGSGNAAYTDKFKMTLAEGQAVVNIQEPGFATAPGIYTTLPAGIISCSLPASAYDVQGAGMILHVAYFTAQETEITVEHGTGTAVFTVYYADGTTGGGGGDPDPDPDPEPAGINWNDYSWIGNGSGNAAYTDKLKMTLATGQAVVNIQQPGFATAPGIYTTFPAGIISCTLPASAYDVQGAGMILHVDYFTYKETEITVVHGTGTAVFTVYYADGIEGSAEPEPEEIYDVNFALASQGSSATASTGTASAAIDGDEDSRWESAQTDDETWTLNMGQKRIFNTIRILWEGAFCKEFNLTYSNDGENWSPLYTETNLTSAGWQTIELGSNVTAQYIKYHGTLRATGWGQSFYEFQVLLPGVQTLTSITLTAGASMAEVGGAGVALTAQPKDQNGQNMEAAVSWEITPAAAGHMSGNTFIPDQAGVASIRAYNGSIYSAAVQILGVPSANLALSTNISTDNKIIAQSEFSPNGTDAFFAVDGNMGSVWQGSPTNGNVDDSREYDCWFVVDLGAYYNISLVALHFEGACSELYHIDFSANNIDWNLGYNLVGAEGINARNDYWTDLDNNTKVRYVRFWSTKSATGWGMKMYEFEVYGEAWSSSDAEKPVMGTASLVSTTYDQAVIAVTATDNDEVARYHVVDGTHGIDANFIPAAGNITVTGLTHGTDYNFTITAKDATGNESDNSVVLPVSTPFNSTINLALNQPSEAGYEDGNPAELAGKANDGNDGSAWVTYGAHAAELDWWVVDLGNIYNLTNITALWADDAYATAYMLQARVEAPTAADKADDAAWVTLATVSGVTAGEERSTNVSGVGRYVRFRATAFAGGFFRLRELRVFGSGVAPVDAEAPVMTSASLVSNTDSRAIIAVAATDDQGVANYHVVDAGHSIDAHLAAEGGNITVSGLAGSTTYTFTITAVDYFGNESANSKSVGVTTTAHLTAPAAVCAAPTWPAAQVKALYSPTYGADYTHQDWGSGTVYTQDTYGKKYETNANGYFGADGFALNCLQMEKLHYDIWIADDATIRIVPIWGGAEQGITVSLTGQQWNSVDIDLTAYNQVTNWGNIYQMKVDYAVNLTFWIANAYFYRTTAVVDNEIPTNASASLVEAGFYSVKITAQAEDNSGSVNFSIRNGAVQVATGAAASGVATTITVSGLKSGTAYSFNVVALDEAGNEAEPVVVAATTRTVPAPAPDPVFTGRKVIPVFTDATTCVVTGIQSGGWGESTIPEWLPLNSKDKVFYVQNFNWAGWHSWGGGDIDASDMQYLHVDFYSTGMTQVSLTPISHDPTHEGSYNVPLTASAWTSVDIPLSEYEAANIEWNKIFQFKFMNPVGGDELMIDNVFFWSYGVQTTPEQTGEETGGWATFAAPIKVEIPSGVKAYKAEYQKNGNEELLILTDIGSVIPANAGVLLRGAANSTYVFTPSEADDPDMSGNALVGCPARTDISSVAASNDIFCLRYSELYSMTGFFLYTGQYIPAGKAYLPLPKSSGPSGAPRHVRFVFSNEQTATGIDAVQGDNVPCTKVIENGQLFIRRGDAVYTIQGTRVQ